MELLEKAFILGGQGDGAMIHLVNVVFQCITVSTCLTMEMQCGGKSRYDKLIPSLTNSKFLLFPSCNSSLNTERSFYVKCRSCMVINPDFHVGVMKRILNS